MKRTWSLFLSACMLAGASAAADTAAVTRQDISHTVFGLGEVQPISQPGVYAQIDAEVSRVLVGVGDAVKKGDLLMELENDELAAEVAQLEYEIQLAQSEVLYTKEHSQYVERPLFYNGNMPKMNQLTGERDTGTYSNEITIYSPCAGRLMAIYIEPGSDALSVYREHGCVAVLSTDGRMKVELSGIEHVRLALDDTVYIFGEGVDTVGRVVELSRRGTEAVIQVIGDEYPMDAPVTVEMPDGTVLGEGVLAVNKPMPVSAYGGTVKGLPWNITVGSYIEQNEIIARIVWSEIPLYLANDEVQRSYAVAKTSLEKAMEKQEALAILAPCDGVIASVEAERGDAVEDGTKLLSLVEDGTGMSLILSVDELDVVRVEKGQTVSLQADALPEVALTGVVQKIAPLGNTETSVTTYDVYVELTGEIDLRVRGGMNVSGEIVVETARDALTIPMDALKKGEDGWYVTLEDGSEAAVEVGVMTDERAQILSGLSEGNRVEY